jgi:hypothetical protein
MREFGRSRAGKTTTTIALLLSVMLGVLSACATNDHHTSASQTVTPAVVTVSLDPRAATVNVPSDFEGFGIEAGNVCAMVRLFASDPAFARLFTNLGPGTIRVGGNSLEGVQWSPDGSASCSTGHSVFTRTLLDQFFAFARAAGWKVTWGLPLRTFDPATYADEGTYALASGSNSILSLEFGNEPDNYGLPFSTYLGEWQAYDAALQPKVAALPLSGPGTAGTAWIPDYLEAEAGRTLFVTAHFYITCASSHPTIADLLSPHSIAVEVATFDRIAAAAHAHGLGYAVNEANNYCLGGMPGVSDVFASALWGADFLFTALEQGAARVNLEGVPNDAQGNWPPHLNYYSPINRDGSVAPLYYAMLLFHAAAAGGKVVSVSLTTGGANVSAHGVLGGDGRLRVILINKELARPATIGITTTVPYHTADALWLQAPSLGAMTGVTLGSSQVAVDGNWSPSQMPTIAVSGTYSTIMMPAGSAVVVTYR